MKTKLIQTQDYLLLIDEEAEIKEGNYYFANQGVMLCSKVNEGSKYPYLNQYGNYDSNHWKEVVIAYYPLNSEAKELDLPLLPNPFNKQIDEVTHLKNLGHECFIQMKKLNPSGGMKEFIRMAVEFGYKAAQSKQFSLEDIKKAFIAGLKFIAVDPNRYEEDADNYIQSLSTQQLPKEFIPEYDSIPNFIRSADNIQEDYRRVLKTITNSEGKEELVGTYKY